MSYLPEITSNLLSVSRLAKKGAKIEFAGNTCVVKDQSNNIIIISSIQNNGIYHIYINNFFSSKYTSPNQKSLA